MVVPNYLGWGPLRTYVLEAIVLHRRIHVFEMVCNHQLDRTSPLRHIQFLLSPHSCCQNLQFLGKTKGRLPHQPWCLSVHSGGVAAEHVPWTCWNMMLPIPQGFLRILQDFRWMMDGEWINIYIYLNRSYGGWCWTNVKDVKDVVSSHVPSGKGWSWEAGSKGQNLWEQ